MDNDSPGARVERTFWTVWNYITEAVSRFFRPEPPNIVRNDLNSIQESADNSEPANCGPAEGDASGREVDEEQHLAKASVLGSSRPVAAWEPCTTDIDLGPDEESKTQLSRGNESEASDQSEGTREEQFIQKGNNEVELLVAKKDDKEECGVHGPDEVPAKDEYEELTGDTKSEDMEGSGRKAGAEEETERTVKSDDQNMDETITKMQVMEEANQMHSDNEQDLKAEEVKLCTTTALSLKEEDIVHLEEARVQQHKADTAITYEEVKDSEGVLLLPASENENESDDGTRQVESQLSVHEELSDDDRDVKEDLIFASLHVELQTAPDKSFIVSEDELIVVGQESEMAQRSENDKDEDAEEKECEIEQESVNEAENNQTMDEVPEQDIKSVTEDSQEEDLLTTHVMCSEEVVQNAKIAEFTDGEQEEVAKDSTRESDDVETGAEDATERAVTPDDQNMDETLIKIQVQEDEKMHHEDEQHLKAEEVKLCTITALSLEEEDITHIDEARVQQHEADTTVTYEEVKDSEGVLLLPASENENKSDDGARQIESQVSVHEELSDDESDVKEDLIFASLHVELQTAPDKSGIVSEDELIVVGQESETAQRSESDKDEDAEEKEDEIEQESVNEAENNQTIDEVPEQDIKDHQEEDMSIGHVVCGEEVVQIPKTDLLTAEFTDGEQEDVAKDSKTRESDDVDTENHGDMTDGKSALTTTDIPVDERFFDKDQVEERLDKEGALEVACPATSVTVKPEGETGQETSREFKNTPQGICEGRIVVSQELNSPTCEETQEGVPEYNNEPAEPDENTTQRFLEVEDCEEIQQLPEEEESKDSESLQNSGCSTGAEHMEEEQDSTEDTMKSFDLVVVEPQETEKPLVEPVIQASRLLFEEEEEKVSVDLMKTGIGLSEKEFESDIGLPKEVQDGTEEPLVEYELDEGICAAGETLKFHEAEDPKMIKPVDATNSGQNSYSLLEDFTESGFLKQSVETEPKLLEDSPVEILDAGIDMEETGYGVEEEAAEDDVQKNNEIEILNLQVTGESSLIAELVETKDELSGDMFEISSDGTKTSESEPKDWTAISPEETAKNVTESEGSYTEQTVSPISGRLDVIDEEILDLWIQAASSEDTDGTKQQEGSKPEQQVDMGKEPSHHEQDEIPSVHPEKGEGHLVESELVSDTEMSSSTAESGFSDQSFCEYGTQNSEAQQLKATSAGSSQGMSDMLVNISESADLSELSTQQPNSQSQDLLMEETLQTRQSYVKEEESGFHADSGVTSSEARPLDQESDKSQEESDKETGLEKEIEADITELATKTDWKDTIVEKTNVADEPLKITVSDSLDEIDHADSGRSRSGSEASLEEGNVSTESGSQDDTCTESEKKLVKLPSLDKPQPRCSEDVTDLPPGLDRAEVAQQPTPDSEELMEVDASLLDFTVQRSRIAVKNPRVRPPKDPRSLLHMPSVEPAPSSRPPVKVPAGVPLGGLGIGIKLPGLGAGFPVLKKTGRMVKDENSPDTLSEEPETKPVEKSDTQKQDETPHKPKWMPPGHAGFGNPLMSELKNKLKKTTKE